MGQSAGTRMDASSWKIEGIGISRWRMAENGAKRSVLVICSALLEALGGVESAAKGCVRAGLRTSLLPYFRAIGGGVQGRASPVKSCRRASNEPKIALFSPVFHAFYPRYSILFRSYLPVPLPRCLLKFAISKNFIGQFQAHKTALDISYQNSLDNLNVTS